MRQHRCPDGVKVARFPGMSGVTRSITVSRLCFLLIFVEFTLCLKVARFPGMSGVSGSIPVSGLCFLLIFVVFTLFLPCCSTLLRACTVKRGAPSMLFPILHLS